MQKYSHLDNTVGKLRSTTDPNHFRRELRNDEKNGTKQVK